MDALLVSPTAAPGGAERSFVNLVRRLPDFGVAPRPILLQRGPLEDWLAEAGHPAEIVPAGRTRQLVETAKVLAALSSMARRCDVVLSNHSKGQFFGGLAAFAARRPAVWRQTGMATRRSTIELAAAAVPARAVICSSRSTYRAQSRLVAERKVRLVSPGVDVEAIARRKGSGADIRTRLGLEDRRVVGIVGRLQPWKGQEVFLRAAARVAREREDAAFLVVGGAILGWEGNYPERLQKLASELGLSGRVHLVGHKDDVYPWFDAMDVVIHASSFEPFGLVLLEAMALGKPLVATRAGGPVDIVEDGVSGLLFPPGDDEALATAVLQILADDDLSALLATNARRKSAAFSVEEMAAGTAAVLKEAVA